jgi:hypothetical protein
VGVSPARRRVTALPSGRTLLSRIPASPPAGGKVPCPVRPSPGAAPRSRAAMLRCSILTGRLPGEPRGPATSAPPCPPPPASNFSAWSFPAAASPAVSSRKKSVPTVSANSSSTGFVPMGCRSARGLAPNTATFGPRAAPSAIRPFPGRAPPPARSPSRNPALSVRSRFPAGSRKADTLGYTQGAPSG